MLTLSLTSAVVNLFFIMNGAFVDIHRQREKKIIFSLWAFIRVSLLVLFVCCLINHTNIRGIWRWLDLALFNWKTFSPNIPLNYYENSFEFFWTRKHMWWWFPLNDVSYGLTSKKEFTLDYESILEWNEAKGIKTRIRKNLTNHL